MGRAGGLGLVWYGLVGLVGSVRLVGLVGLVGFSVLVRSSGRVGLVGSGRLESCGAGRSVGSVRTAGSGWPGG